MDRKTFVSEVATAIVDQLRVEDVTLTPSTASLVVTECIGVVISRACTDVRGASELWLAMSGEEPLFTEEFDPKAPILSSMRVAIFEAALTTENLPICNDAFDIFYRDNEFLSPAQKQNILAAHRTLGYWHSWRVYLEERASALSL